VQGAVYEAHKIGLLPVLSHAIGIEGIRNGVAVGVDSIDHGHYLDEEQAVKMKQKGIYLVPTFSPTHCRPSRGVSRGRSRWIRSTMRPSRWRCASACSLPWGATAGPVTDGHDVPAGHVSR